MYIQFLLFILKYRPVYTTEATLNDIKTYARFFPNSTCECMTEQRICIHKISEEYIFLAYAKPFIRKLFEGPPYVYLF